MEQVLTVGSAAVLIILTIFYLLRALGKPSFYFNLESQNLEVRKGTSKRRIPFREIAKLSLAAWNVDIDVELPGVQIKLELKNGETLELGNLSSIKGQEDLWKRCKDICCLVAGASGTDIPPEVAAISE